MWQVCKTGEMHKEFWLEDLRERDHLEDGGVDGNIIMKWIFKNRKTGHRLD